MTSQAARISPLQKCRKTGTSATCWVIPNTIWNRLADQPENSRRARLGIGMLPRTSSLRRASIKARTSLAHHAGYQSGEKMSIVERGAAAAAAWLRSNAADGEAVRPACERLPSQTQVRLQIGFKDRPTHHSSVSHGA